MPDWLLARKPLANEFLRRIDGNVFFLYDTHDFVVSYADENLHIGI